VLRKRIKGSTENIVGKRCYNIATAADSAYFVPAYVMLLSLFTNNKAHGFNVFLLTNSFTERQKQAFQELCAKHGSNISFLAIDTRTIDKYEISAYLSRATYYRFYLPVLLPQDIDNVLYLDGDIIVNAEISELFDTDLSGRALAAIKEVLPYNIGRLSIPAHGDYFNAGVLLINLSAWREYRYDEQLIYNVERNPSRYIIHDQDALNELFYDKVRYIDPIWNQQTPVYQLDRRALEKRYNGDASELLERPKIVHFTGQYKPWHYLCTHPQKELFKYYLDQTLYTDFSEKASLRRISNKFMLRVRHKLKKTFK
jgi:lipopolysaccharide biosynthesis glycosyltransferase